MGVGTFALVYIVGGLTFLPLLAAAIFISAFLLLPANIDGSKHGSQEKDKSGPQGLPAGGISEKELAATLEQRHDDTETASGYFAVTRQYRANAVSAKAPEKMAPAGDAAANESPSVYQSMYRSVFERGKTAGPVLDKDDVTGGKDERTGVLRRSRPRNVFFIVVR